MRVGVRVGSLLSAVVLGLTSTACESDDPPRSTPTPSSATSSRGTSPPANGHTVLKPDPLPTELDGVPAAYPWIPTAFPGSIGELPPLPFDGKEREFEIAYRPYEVPDGRTGWASEETAVLSHGGGWYRVPLGTLGLPEETWRGPDPIGPGQLNTDGDLLLLGAARGAIVLDLATGEARQVLTAAGRLGLVDWVPGENSLLAMSTATSRSFEIDLDDGEVRPLRSPLTSVGFSHAGQQCAAVSHQRNTAVLSCERANAAVPSRAVLPLPGVAAGDELRSWASSRYVALSELGGRTIYAYEPGRGRSVRGLHFSARTATYLLVHGWIDSRRLLISMSGSLLTWNPRTSEVVRIARLPRSDVGYTHGAVGIRFPPLRGGSQ